MDKLMAAYIVISIIIFIVICLCLSSIIGLSCSICYKPNADGVLYLPSTVFDGDLEVNGFSYFNGPVTAQKNLTVGGDLSVDKNLGVGGDSNFGGKTTTKGLSVNGSGDKAYIVNYGDGNNKRQFIGASDGKLKVYVRDANNSPTGNPVWTST